MAFNKNWNQWKVSKGEPFKIEHQDRKYRGVTRTVFEVTEDGVVEVDGVELTGDQNVAGSIVATAAITAGTTVTGADLVATDDLTVGDDATITGDAAVGGTLAVTGVSTFTGLAKLPAASFFTVVHAGKNGTGAVTLTGAKVGDLVIGAAQIGTTPGDAKSKFETVITVVDQIQQTSATDLSSEQILFILLHQS
jgi:hypothetical protein